MTLYSINKGNPQLINYLVMAEKYNLIIKSENWSIQAELIAVIQENLNENTKALIFGLEVKVLLDSDLLLRI